MEIAICPNCKKEVPEDSKSCSHCLRPIVSVKHKSVFSWQLSDKIFLFAAIILLIGFFQPWFPGSILNEDKSISPYRMLLNIVDLEIDFLESYNILRMILIVPIFSILLYFMIYLRASMQKTLFPSIFLFLISCASILPFFFRIAGTTGGVLMSLVFLFCIIAYYRKAYKSGRLGYASYFVLLIFMCLSVFIYQLDLGKEFYVNLETIKISQTYGFWLTWLTFGTLIFTIILSFMKTVEDFWLMTFGVLLSLIAYNTFIHPLFVSGPFAFFANNFSEVGIQAVTHIKIVFIALGIAIVTGVPLGVYITRNPAAARIVLYISSILITIPSIAMFGFMMPILSSIDKSWDAVSGIGIGAVPAVLALALYSLLPIIRNTYIALKNVDPATIEAGRGMGMTPFQLLIKLQLPLSAPIIMAGVRTAVVMGIAIGAIAAYIGAGGLGIFVSQGLQMSTNDSVVAGAVSMSLLAILADIFLEQVEDWITPAGLKIES